jgi:hypothetical protein
MVRLLLGSQMPPKCCLLAGSADRRAILNFSLNLWKGHGLFWMITKLTMSLDWPAVSAPKSLSFLMTPQTAICLLLLLPTF